MKDSKLIDFLRLLNKEEFARFGLFVHSPYYNNLQKVTALYEALKKHHPAFESKRLTREFVFSKIFPGTRFDDSRLRALSSYLLTLAKKFLIAEGSASDAVDSNLRLYNTLRDRNDNYFSGKLLKDARSAVQNSQTRNSGYYHKLFHILYEENSAFSHFTNKRNFQKEADALTIYYLGTALRTFSTAFNRKNSLESELSISSIDSIARLAEQLPFKRIPVVRLNYCLYMITRYLEKEEFFFEFIRLAENFPHALGERELYEAHFILLNFCVLKIQRGEKSYSKVKYNLYKNMLRRDLFSLENHFPYAFFNNIVSSALENGDADFAARFIEENSALLEPLARHDITWLSRAKVCFAKKDFDGTIAGLARTGNNEDIFYRLAVRDLYIKAYFEKGEFEYILSLIDSYKHFINKNRLLNTAVKKRYMLYLKSAGELIRLRQSPHKERTEMLLRELNSTDGFANKDWVLEKLGDLNK